MKKDNIAFDDKMHIKLLRFILILKRLVRFVKRIFKEMGSSIFITVFLLAFYVLVSIYVEIRIEKKENIINIIWNYTPMIYTTVVVAFVGNIVNFERNRKRCLIKQYSFYEQLRFNCEWYINEMVNILQGSRCVNLYDNICVDRSLSNVHIINKNIDNNDKNRIDEISKEFLRQIEDLSKIWLGYEFIDCDLHAAAQYSSELNISVTKIIEGNTRIEEKSIKKIIMDAHYFLAQFRRPWRYDNKIDNKIRALQSNRLY